MVRKRTTFRKGDKVVMVNDSWPKHRFSKGDIGVLLKKAVVSPAIWQVRFGTSVLALHYVSEQDMVMKG